jgi:ADP-ribose pyrophosphatase
MDADRDVELIDREICYQGFFRLEKLHLRHRRFAGDWTPVIDREVLVRQPAVAVLPYDPVTDQVVLLEQFRPGAYGAGRSAWMVEIPAGLVEQGEAPTDVAAREAKEEIGLTLLGLERIAEFMPSPGGMTEVVTLFCGRVDATKADGIFGVETETEDIRSFAVAADGAIGMLGQPGCVDNGFTIIALQWLALHRASLLRKWSDDRGDP